MANRAFSLLLTGLLLLGLFAVPAQAQDRSREIRTMLEQRDREIKNVLGTKKTFTDAQREQLKVMVNGIIDFEAMSKAALGPHWNGLTAPQRKAFVDVFSEIVRNQSLANLDIYRTKVTYDKINVQGDSAHVSTTVTYKNVPTEVEYVMGYRDKAWRVDDIVLDSVSTAGGYARSFQTVIRKKGFDALMKSLRSKLEQVQAKG